MDNQHRKISGYRDLTQDEVDLMNEAKALEAKCLAFQKKVMRYLAEQEKQGGDEVRRQQEAFAHRWAQIGKTDIERGFMALVRAVAQPQPVTIPEE